MPNNEMKTVLFIVNVDWFLVSHRLPIAMAARQRGYEVHVGASTTISASNRLASEGIFVHKLPISRSSGSPIKLAREFLAIFRLLKAVRADVIHLVTLKPILLGGIAARLIGCQNVILAIPGRGLVFVSRGIAAFARRMLVISGYRMAYSPGATKVVVQNVEDQEYFVRKGVFRSEDVWLIRGSGVDLNAFCATPESDSVPIVMLASRMLREKGIAEFVAAARILSSRGVRAKYVLVGGIDRGNPHGLTNQEMSALTRDQIVEWIGHCDDMPRMFAESHIVCLPSYYGEGVPKVLIEAAASGRPIVTTDTPGCRDIVHNNQNGILVRPRDVDALVDALSRLISDGELRKRLGAAGRELAERQFSLSSVVNQTLELYESTQK